MKQTGQCVFCSVVSASVEAEVIFQDEVSLVFLDHRPIFQGHCLIIPKIHYQTLPDLPEDLSGKLILIVQKICRAVESGLEAEGTFVALNNKISQSVPHVHFHVVPRRKGDGLKGFFWPRYRYKDRQEMKDCAEKIRESL